jgi:DNA helicase-2/ATP-dependent DNA helicase PcrA
VIGGPRFYERMEIRDAIAYLRLVNQPNDDLAFERIINTPKRGLGAKTIQDLYIAARAMRMPLFPAAEQLVQTDELKPSPRSTLQKFISDVNRWKAAIDTMAPQDLTAMVLEESDYIAMWREDKSIDAAGRINNLKELINAISDFTTLGAFLEHIALVMESHERGDMPRATLMTLHQAKGLEYRHVFLPGWEEDLFPSKRSMDEGLPGLEEERRLAYVALTRARSKAHIFYALRRQIYGIYTDTIPSRFIDEIPPGHINDQRKDIQQRLQQSTQVQSTTRWGGGRNYTRAAPKMIDAVAVHIPTNSSFKIGQRVFHDKFGYGRVTDINEDKLYIDFEKAGPQKVIDKFVRPAEQA